jgi:hypothetical protein
VTAGRILQDVDMRHFVAKRMSFAYNPKEVGLPLDLPLIVALLLFSGGLAAQDFIWPVYFSLNGIR